MVLSIVAVLLLADPVHATTWTDPQAFLREAGLTTVRYERAQQLFDQAISDEFVRMKIAGSYCYSRALKLKRLLHKQGVEIGFLDLNCGRTGLHVKDRATRDEVGFATHTANVIAVQTGAAPELYVLDGQFLDGPIRLRDYLSTVIHPAYSMRTAVRGLGARPPGPNECQWSLDNSVPVMIPFGTLPPGWKP